MFLLSLQSSTPPTHPHFQDFQDFERFACRLSTNTPASLFPPPFFNFLSFPPPPCPLLPLLFTPRPSSLFFSLSPSTPAIPPRHAVAAQRGVLEAGDGRDAGEEEEEEDDDDDDDDEEEEEEEGLEDSLATLLWVVAAAVVLLEVEEAVVAAAAEHGWCSEDAGVLVRRKDWARRSSV